MSRVELDDERRAQIRLIPVRVFATCRDKGITADQQKTIFMYVLSEHVAWGVPVNLKYCRYVVNLVQLSLDRSYGDRLYDQAYLPHEQPETHLRID
jgi:hypothetical protein